MHRLWDFDADRQIHLIELALRRHGKLIGEMSSPHSSIFTFDQGANVSPRYIVAKGIQLNDEMSSNEKWKYLSRALYEVNNAHSVCHHPLIQRFFDVDVIHGAPFLLSRKRDATLRDVIKESPLGEVEAVSIAIQIAHGLIYCAGKGILCHQDLKPENVFVDFIADHFRVPAEYPLRSRIFIADFELANAYWLLRHPYGSRPYMAPEQYQSMQDEGPLPDFSRVDVFAIGVILYEMLTGGVHPVGQHTSLIWPTPAQGQSSKWLRETPWKKWIARGANLNSDDLQKHSPELVDLIQKCLKPDASERLSKEDLKAQLCKYLAQIDQFAHKSLLALLSDFDRLADEGEESGWPHYASRVESLNDAFSDNSEL